MYMLSHSVVHLDLKLLNIMLDEDLGLHNLDGLVKIIDFGASKNIQEFPNGLTSY